MRGKSPPEKGGRGRDWYQGLAQPTSDNNPSVHAHILSVDTRCLN